jgi:RNA polymerase sigma factor (sigma-70 family)
MDDSVMLARWREGEVGAGQQLVRRHLASVYGFFATKCPDLADELVQQTFLACVKTRDAFRGDSTFRTYLFSIARKQLWTALDARQRTQARIDYAISSIADLISTPATRLARDQEHRHLLDALRHLPLEQQTLLELHYWEELDASQLAVVFETNDIAIRQRLSRARKALRMLLERSAPPRALETLETMDVWVRGACRPNPS